MSPSELIITKLICKFNCFSLILNQNLNGKGVLSLKGEVFDLIKNGVALIVLQKQH
jgi:hypothetical protein